MSKSPIVDQIRAVLFSEHKWTKRAKARNGEGKSVATTDPYATCYCLIGAVEVVDRNLPYGPQRGKPYCIVQQAIYSHTPFRTISAFNDYPLTDFESIQRLLDKAAEIEEQTNQ